MIHFSFTLTLLAALVSSAHAEALTPIDETILSVALNPLCVSTAGKYTVLSNLTDSVAGRLAPKELDGEAWLDLKERNSTSTKIPDSLACEGVRVVDESKIHDSIHSTKDLIANLAWPGFYSAFPGATGTTRLSQPGFSKDRKIVIIQISHGCGMMCGRGDYLQFVLTDGKWVLQKKVMAWVS